MAPARLLPALVVLALTSGCASRQRHHEKTLRECSTSGDAGRRVERRGGVGAYAGLDASAVERAGNEVTEIRDDCVYTVHVRAGSRRWEVSGLSWVGEYVGSKRGDRVAFIAQDPRGWHVVVDGALGPSFDGTSSRPIFSEDGQHVMFVGYDEGSGGRVFVDGEEVGRAPFGIDTGAYGFTSDGRYLIAIRTEDGGLRVSAGGALGPKIDSALKGTKIVASTTALDLTRSASGGRFAYVGTRGGRGVLVVDGREVPVPEGRLPARPVFSASGARLIYRALAPSSAGEKGAPSAVVIDGALHVIPGITSAEFAGGEIPMVKTIVTVGLNGQVSSTVLFGVDRLDQGKPAGEPEDRIILEDRWMEAQDIEVLADGRVTHRGLPFAQVRGRRAPTRAE